jgi:hypothetical protein
MRRNNMERKKEIIILLIEYIQREKNLDELKFEENNKK